jgi:hypothetical protein
MESAIGCSVACDAEFFKALPAFAAASPTRRVPGAAPLARPPLEE